MLTTIPETLVRLASGWLHGDSLLPAGLTATKKALSNLTVLVTMLHNSALHFIEIHVTHHCMGFIGQWIATVQKNITYCISEIILIGDVKTIWEPCVPCPTLKGFKWGYLET